MGQRRNKVQTTFGLDADLVQRLQDLAARRGIGWTTLGVQLIRERLVQVEFSAALDDAGKERPPGLSC